MKRDSKSQRNDSNGRILGKVRSSSAPGVRAPAGTVLTGQALGFRGHPPTCPPAPQPPKEDPREGKHRPFSHQKTRLYISSETSESNRDCCFFFLSVGCAPRPSLLHGSLPSSTFLHPKLPSALGALPKRLLRPKTKCRVPVLLPPLLPPSLVPPLRSLSPSSFTPYFLHLVARIFT